MFPVSEVDFDAIFESAVKHTPRVKVCRSLKLFLTFCNNIGHIATPRAEPTQREQKQGNKRGGGKQQKKLGNRGGGEKGREQKQEGTSMQGFS